MLQYTYKHNDMQAWGLDSKRYVVMDKLDIKWGELTLLPATVVFKQTVIAIPPLIMNDITKIMFQIQKDMGGIDGKPVRRRR